jgi:phage terminase large subunit-like protein
MTTTAASRLPSLGSHRSGRVLGSVEPRLWTPPLRDLTPATSCGFDQIEFARDFLGRPLDAWQQWLVIHAGELLEDGRPRFRTVIVIVARQNGKTEVPVVLSLYWQVVEQVGLILGTSTKIDYARESWAKAWKLAERAPGLSDVVPSHLTTGPDAAKRRRLWLRQANGEQESELAGSRYKIAAANEEGGRSLTVSRAILDELRQHHDYSAWDAVIPAGRAVADFQAWCLSNAGTARSVVLNEERAAALRFIDTGDGDARTGLFEWSAPEGADPLDLTALAQANPNMGHRIDPDALLSDALKAVQAGGDKLAGFRIESMCQTVPTLRQEIDPDVWESRADRASQITGRVGIALEVALDQSSTSIAAAGWRGDGRVHGEVIDERGGTAWAPARVVELVRRWDPVMVALDPSSPAGHLAADIRRELSAAGLDPDSCTR